MKKAILFLALTLSSLMTLATATNQPDKPKKMLRHVVLFKFKDSATPADVKTVEDAFMKLPSEIKEIKALEWGINNSPETHSQGFTHCFFVTFADEAGRAIYLPHPAHKAFGKVLGPYLDKVLVVDYWTN